MAFQADSHGRRRPQGAAPQAGDAGILEIHFPTIWTLAEWDAKGVPFEDLLTTGQDHLGSSITPYRLLLEPLQGGVKWLQEEHSMNNPARGSFIRMRDNKIEVRVVGKGFM